MPTDVIMPQLGESIAEGTLVKWLIQPGGQVKKDQPLLEVETDKVALEIPSPAGGTLTEVLVAEGDTVPVGTLLARLNEDSVATEVINRVGGVVVRPTPESTLHLSPAVRQLAQEHGVEVSKISGTGEGGRVTKKDILNVVAAKQSSESHVTAMCTEPQLSMTPHDEEVRPCTPMRKTIAERMVQSRKTAAHVVTVFEADMTLISHTRSTHKLTYLPFIIHGVTRALKEFPMVNASWSDQGIVLKRAVHMGIAVALDEGLLVPVVRNADQKGVLHLAKEVADLADRARSKRLNPEEVQDGTFTITNHGGFGSLFSTPIIHQPQTAILGVGAVQKRPVVINDAIAIKPMCYLSLAFDHRVIDGATADQFMSMVQSHIEHSDWEKYL